MSGPVFRVPRFTVLQIPLARPPFPASSYASGAPCAEKTFCGDAPADSPTTGDSPSGKQSGTPPECPR